MIHRRFGESSENGRLIGVVLGWRTRSLPVWTWSTRRIPKRSPSFRSASARKYWYSSGVGMDRSSTVFPCFCQFPPFIQNCNVCTFTSSTTAVVTRSVWRSSISLVERKLYLLAWTLGVTGGPWPEVGTASKFQKHSTWIFRCFTR